MKTIKELFKPFPMMINNLTKLSPMVVDIEEIYSGGGCSHYMILLSDGHIFQYHNDGGDFIYSADTWDNLEEYYESGLDESDNAHDYGKIGGFGWEFIHRAEGLSKGFSICCEEEDMTPKNFEQLDELVESIIKNN